MEQDLGAMCNRVQFKAMNVYSLLTQHHLVSIWVNMQLATDYKQFSLMSVFCFLCVASEVPQRAVFTASVTVKEGFLHKHKAEGPQLLSRFAFKKRYFWLTSETLSYAKTPDWQVGTVPAKLYNLPTHCISCEYLCYCSFWQPATLSSVAF